MAIKNYEALKGSWQRTVRKIMATLPVEERLEGISPEERLAGLSPEEIVQAVKPEDYLRGLSPEELERLKALLH